MRLSFCFLSATLATGFGLVAQPSAVFAQQPGSVQTAVAELPEAPRAQFEVAEAEPQAQQPPAVQSQATQQPPTSATPAQGSSSSQSSAQQPGAEKSQHEKAAEQIKEQEKQRVVGILPQFNISYRSDAASMTAAQKMRLAFRSSVDPVAFATAFVAAGYHEAMDSFDGDIIGNGILPSLLHQDPRYFRLGHGTFTHRLLYSLATNVICKHDNTGRWEPNYSNVSGNIISGAISNLYYPSTNSGVSQTFTNGFMVTAEGGIGSIFDEFWPDVSRKFLHRDPTHGLDAQARAADKAKKEARQEQK
jgi:hypothetical protein